MQLFNYLARFLLVSFALGASIPQSPDIKELDQIVQEYKAALKKTDHCDIANAHLPRKGKNPELPNPNSNLTLKYVTFGIGTQNYTCAGKDASAKPTAVGALATLYDATCFINLPESLDVLSEVVLRHPTKSVVQTVSKSLGMNALGHHYFVEKVPFFDLRGQGHSDQAMVSVVNKVPAPDSKNVEWLKLDQKSGSGIQVCSPFLQILSTLPILMLKSFLSRRFSAFGLNKARRRRHAKARNRTSKCTTPPSTGCTVKPFNRNWIFPIGRTEPFWCLGNSFPFFSDLFVTNTKFIRDIQRLQVTFGIDF